MAGVGWREANIKLTTTGSRGGRISASDVPAGPPRHRTRPRMAPLLEIAEANRLSPRPVRFDSPGPHRQAAGLRHRPRFADLGPHVSLPVRDPRAQLRSDVAWAPAHRVWSGDASAAGSDLEPARGGVVSGVRMVLPDGPVQRGPVVRHVAPRP